MKKFIIIMIIVASMSAGAAFGIGEKAGTTTGEFLRLPAGAKPAAMGQAYAALADDAYAMYYNIAGLAGITQQSALLAHTMYYVDVNHEYASYARPFLKGGIGASFTYLMTDFEKRSADTETADSHGNIGDMAISIGYAQSLKWGLDGGVAVKYISSNLDDDTAKTAAFDLGIGYQINDKISAGLALNNIGGSLKYISESVSVGNMLDAGVGAKGLLLDNLTLAMDYNMLVNASYKSINIGAQYLWQLGEDWTMQPRAGFISNNTTLTAGLGFTYKLYQVDYAINYQADLGINNRVSMGLKF